MITFQQILPAMVLALQHDDFFGNRQIIPTIRYAHSGVFEFQTQPTPAIILAPGSETNPRRPVTKNGEKLLQVTAHIYTQEFWNGRGLMGDAVAQGVIPLADLLEIFFDSNLLSDKITHVNLVVNALVLGKEFPKPQDMNFIGINEARVLIEYFTINPQYV